MPCMQAQKPEKQAFAKVPHLAEFSARSFVDGTSSHPSLSFVTGAIKVECGSQFSVCLTRSGAVFTWGKGDYHRLGLGTDDHVRRPRKVAALQGKRVISIAAGSLHCVACTDQGKLCSPFMLDFCRRKWVDVGY